jgi:hypothetical protein
MPEMLQGLGAVTELRYHRQLLWGRGLRQTDGGFAIAKPPGINFRRRLEPLR